MKWYQSVYLLIEYRDRMLRIGLVGERGSQTVNASKSHLGVVLGEV